MHIQYKYVVRNKDGSVVRWQEGANVSLDLPGGNAAELALDVEDSWNKSKQVCARPAVDGIQMLRQCSDSSHYMQLSVFVRPNSAPW
jgi:hypothetical protein